MAGKHKKRGAPGGWPRDATPAPIPAGKRERAVNAEGALALQRIAHEYAAGSFDPAETQRRLARLRELFLTHPKLSQLWPSAQRAVAAAREFVKGKDLPPGTAEAAEAARQALYDHVIPKVFDEAFMERLRQEFLDAALYAKTKEDGNALALGLLCSAAAPSGDNPVLQILLGLCLTGRDRLAAMVEESGLPTSRKEAERLLRNPEELERVSKDPARAARMRAAMRQDPVLRHAAVSMAHDAQGMFATAVADGAIRAHLTAAELHPALGALARVAHTLQLGEEDKDEVARQLIEICMDFAKHPANRPAFERFTQEVQRERDAMDLASQSEAPKLRVLAGFWLNRWREDAALRAHAVYASALRVGEEAGTEGSGPA